MSFDFVFDWEQIKIIICTMGLVSDNDEVMCQFVTWRWLTCVAPIPCVSAGIVREAIRLVGKCATNRCWCCCGRLRSYSAATGNHCATSRRNIEFHLFICYAFHKPIAWIQCFKCKQTTTQSMGIMQFTAWDLNSINAYRIDIPMQPHWMYLRRQWQLREREGISGKLAVHTGTGDLLN